MKKTRVRDLLKIKYPIFQGGMLWLANADLAAAVSNAGGLGIISPLAGMEKHGNPSENLKNQIAKTRELSKKPFGVNIPLDLHQSGALMDVILKEKVGVVITAAGNPEYYTELLHQNNIIVLHVVSSVKQAKKAEDCNVDAIIAEGVEAAGHIGLDELPLFSLIPQVADAVAIPVIAAGGIADARGLVAAFSLGAEGVQMGTRFIAVKENIADPLYKEAIINADDTDTVITCRKLSPTRSLKTKFTLALLELEKSGAGVEEIADFIGFRRSRKAQIEGDLTKGEVFCGTSAGLIKEIASVSSVIQDLVKGYREITADLSENDM